MPCIQTKELAVGNRISKVKLVRADDVTLRADAEEFGLDGITVILGVESLGKNLVERFFKNHSGRFAVSGHILLAIGYPDVGYAGTVQRFADV